MFVRVWHYDIRHGADARFEEVYGPSGAWAELFSRAIGYLATELRRLPEVGGRYETVDRWQSRAAWETFLENHALAYEQLDRACDELTERETLVREYDEPDA